MGKWNNYLKAYGNVQIINGGTPDTKTDKYWDGNIGWLSVDDFNNGNRYVYDAKKSITKEGLKSSSTKVLSKGHLIISARGTVGVIAQLGSNLAFNQSCYGLHSTKYWSDDFLYYYLSYISDEIKSISHGNVFGTITQDSFKDIKIPCVSEKEQAKIAEILTTVDTAINKTKVLIEKYKNIKEGLLQDLLTNGIDEKGKIRSPKTHKYKPSPLGMIPVEWDCVELSDFVGKDRDCIVAGPFGSDLKVSDYCDEGIPLIRLQNVGSDVFINKDIIYISREKAKELKRHSYMTGDVVLAKLGIPIGKTAIVPDDFYNGIVVADVVRIRQNPNVFNKHFLMFMLNSEIGRRQLNSEKIGTTRPRVNISQLKKIWVKKPKIDEQNKIGIQVFEIQSKVAQEELYMSKLQSLKKGLMQDLLTNTVSVESLL